MKLSGIFKKEVKASSAKVEKLEKKQLNTVIGGRDEVSAPGTDPEALVNPIPGIGIVVKSNPK